MTTQILNLPVLTVAAEIGSNEDWLDSLLFANPVTGVPIDLTGISFAAEVHAVAGDQQPVISASTTGSTMTNGTTSGILSFAVPNAAIVNQSAGPYVFDVLATADGHTRRVVIGTLQLDQGVTA